MELAAELHDLVKEDIARLQPQLRVSGAGPGGACLVPIVCKVASHKGNKIACSVSSARDVQPAMPWPLGVADADESCPLQGEVRISVVDTMDHLLGAFQR